MTAIAIRVSDSPNAFAQCNFFLAQKNATHLSQKRSPQWFTNHSFFFSISYHIMAAQLPILYQCMVHLSEASLGSWTDFTAVTSILSTFDIVWKYLGISKLAYSRTSCKRPPKMSSSREVVAYESFDHKG